MFRPQVGSLYELSIKTYGILRIATYGKRLMFGRNQGDLRVKRLLDTIGYNYSITSDGDFRLNFQINDERSQVCFIDSDTCNINNIELRRIWSVAYTYPRYLDIDTANSILIRNYQYKIGSWGLGQLNNGQFFLAFFIQIAAETDPSTLEITLNIVSSEADKMEKELTGEDNF